MQAPGHHPGRLLELARDRGQQLVQKLQESADDARQWASALAPPAARQGSPQAASGQAKVIDAALAAAEQTLAALRAAALANPQEDDAA
jgi:hypothetical protein